MSKSKIFSLVSLFLLTTVAHAEPVDPHVLVVPHCLLKNVSGNYQTITNNPHFALISANTDIVESLAEQKHLDRNCGGFVDVTNDWQAYQGKSFATRANDFLKNVTDENTPNDNKSNPYKIQYEKEVVAVLGQSNAQNMWTNLTTLTNFKDRYADSSYGIDASNWLKSQVESLAKETHHENTMEIYFVDTHSYKQPSLIAKFGKSNEPGIIISAHMDTLSSRFGGNKPGADDDGTGSVTVLETARTILTSGMHFKRPIYFMWYAAEEEGLVGSKEVVAEFKKRNIPIHAVLHFDMTGYTYKNDPSMWLITDYVNKDLTKYLEQLITTYVKQTVKYTQCGYGCSDHASWHKNGFPASIAAETKFENTNPNMHTSRDSMDKLSLTHMTDYLKLALAFSVELAEPTANA